MIKYIVVLLCLLVSPVWAAGPYYIKDDGNNSYTGLSDAQAWLTLSKAAGLAEGSDVYLKCDDTWTSERITVNWSGTSGDRVIIGAYYMNGSETVGVSGSKPIITGPQDYSYPSSEYNALVETGTQTYVTITNLDLQYSGGYAFFDDYGTHYTIINNVDMSYIWKQAMSIKGHGVIVEYCTVQHFAMREAGDFVQPWPYGIGFRGNDCIARYNKVGDGYGEGITSITASGTQIYNNLIYDTGSCGIYLDATQNCNVHHNLIYGTNDTTYTRPGDSNWHFQGIHLNIEDDYWEGCTGNKIHNNIVINMYTGISAQNSKNNSSYKVENNEFYNNTLIDNYRNVYLWNSNGAINYVNYFKNNLSYDNHADSQNITIAAPNPTNWVADYNAWYPSYNEGDNALSGGNDVTGDPGFSKATWRGTTTLNDESFTIANIGLASGVDQVDAGATLNQAYDDGFNAASAKPPTAATTSDQDDNGDPPDNWEIGAVIRTGAEDPPAPTVTITTTTPLTCPYGQDPQDVTFSGTSDVNAYYRISTTNQTWDQMTDAKAVQNGNGTQSYSHVISLACGQTISYYVAGSTEAGDNGAESATQEDEVVIGSEEGQNPPAAVTLYNDGSGDIGITLYNDSSGAIGVTLQ